MVKSCSALNCSEKWEKHIKKKFHRIPQKDMDLRTKWLGALRRKNYDPKDAFICEKHFTSDDYEMNVHGNRCLKKGAIPSIFDFSTNVKHMRKRSARSTNAEEELVADQLEVRLKTNSSDGDAPVTQIDTVNKGESDAVLINSVEDTKTGKLKSEESYIQSENIEPYGQPRFQQNKSVEIKNESTVLQRNEQIEEKEMTSTSNTQGSERKFDIMELSSDHLSRAQLETSKSDVDNGIQIECVEIKKESAALLEEGPPPSIKFDVTRHLRPDYPVIQATANRSADEEKRQIDTIKIKHESEMLSQYSLEEVFPFTSMSEGCDPAPFKRRRRDPVYFGDFEEADLHNEVTRSRFWRVAQETVLKQKKRLKFFQCKVRRQSAKIKVLKKIAGEIRETKQKDKVSEIRDIVNS